MLSRNLTCSADAEPPTKTYRTQPHLRPRHTNGELIENNELIVENVPLTYEGYTYRHSHIAYIKGRPPAPVILVHPNYAGLKQFDIDQACFLARCGYVGFALDLYKDIESYKYEDRNPSKDRSTQELRDLAKKHFVGAFSAMNEALRHPKHWRGLMNAYLQYSFTHPAVKAKHAGAVGYCFGGQCLLEQVRAGHELQAVVSFHGLLQSRPTFIDDPLGIKKGRITAEMFAKEVDVAPNNYTKNCKVLIENGDADDHVSESSIAEWKKEMDDANIDWVFHNHAKTPHGFALAEGVWSTEYVEAADRRSTLSMLSLFAETWPSFPQFYVDRNACGTLLNQSILTKARL
eukprot:g5873.t1